MGLPPTFLLIGAGKSGTTSLFQYLCHHPDVYGTSPKEPRFFATQANLPPQLADAPWLVRTWEEYLSLFDGARPDQARGEASMAYLHSSGVVEGVRARIPDVRLLVILRHPAEAAWSHYLMSRRGGRGSRSLGQMIDEEPLEPRVSPFENNDHALVRIRFYHDHLTRWLEVFPAEQLLVLLHDDLVSEPEALVRRAWAHIGVDPTAPIDARERHNVGSAPRSMGIHAFAARSGTAGRLVKGALRHVPGRRAVQDRVNRWNERPAPSLPDGVRQQLLDIYREDTTALEAMLGRDLSAWKR